jgi:imidazole glycerol-phosphate synthase subunit HisH
MSDRATVAIIDYHMGNLFSVQRACEWAGLHAIVTSNPKDIDLADAVILPGVGAFATAMRELDRTGMSDAVREFVSSSRPFLGICLGIQLLMTESTEFGVHPGLGIIPGRAISFEPCLDAANPVKVPHMQWNQIRASRRGAWDGTLLDGLQDGEFMYFVHSYYVVPDSPSVSIATTAYANVEFCAALQVGSIFACQFHPERSGQAGLHIYQSLAQRLGSSAPARTSEGASR